MEFDELEQLLCDSISGDNKKIQNAYDAFQKACGDVESLIRCFFLVLQDSKNETARNAAIIVYTRLIRDNWDSFSEELQNEIYNTLFAIQEIIDESKLHIFISLVHTVIQCVFDNIEKRLKILTLFNFHNIANTTKMLTIYQGIPNNDGSQKAFSIQLPNISFDDKPEDFTEEQYKRRCLKSHFMIEMLCNFDGLLGINEIAKNLEASIHCVNLSLNDENVYYQSLGIKAVSLLIELYPSQVDQFNDHITRMIEIARDSLQMEDMDFQIIWKSFSCFFDVQSTECMNRVSFLLKDFLSIIFAAVSRTDILPESRMCPLWSFRRNLEYLEPDLLVKIAYLSIDIATENVRLLHQLCYSYIFYDECFNTFPHVNLYELSRKILFELIASDDFAKKITALCLIKLIIIHLPHQVYTDIKTITKLTEEALKQEDDLYLEAGCEIVSSFYYFFTWNLVDLSLFLPLTVPLLVHSSSNVREVAYSAVENIFCISYIPNHSCVSLILEQMPKVIDIDNYRYLKLLSISIKNHGYFEPEESSVIESTVLPLLDSEDPGTLCGGLQIAMKLMQFCEGSRKSLLEKARETIDKLILNTDDSKFVYLGIAELVHYFKMINNYKQDKYKLRNALTNHSVNLSKSYGMKSNIQNSDVEETVSKYSEKIHFMLNLDSKEEALLKTLVLPKIAYIDSILVDHPYFESLLSEAMPFFEMEAPNYVISALKVLKKITPIMTEENAFAAFNAIGTACVKTKEVVVACEAYSVMGYIIRYSSPEIRKAVLPAAHHMCSLYVKGELSVLDGMPPLTTDFDVSLMYATMQLFISLFFEKTESQEVVIKELFSIYNEHKNLLTNEMILYVFSRALACDILSSEQQEELYQLTLSLLVEDQDFVLMMSTSNLVSVFLHKQFFDMETFDPILKVLVEWWSRMKSERHQLRSTYSIMAMLFWEIAYHFKLIDKLLNIFPNQSSENSNELSLFEETFVIQYPPDNLSRLENMTKILIQIFNDEQCKKSIMEHDNLPKIITVAICKLLIRPKIDLLTRGVTKEMTESVQEILTFIRSNKPEVTEVITDFIGEIPSRRTILQKFL